MLNVVCAWPDGQWALVLGIVREEFDGIWSGQAVACPIHRFSGGVVAAPIMLLVLRGEDFNNPDYMQLAYERLADQFPEDDTIVPLVLSEEARIALEDGHRVQFSSDQTFGSATPTGWKNCRFIEVRTAETEEAFVASLEGRNITDLRDS